MRPVAPLLTRPGAPSWWDAFVRSAIPVVVGAVIIALALGVTSQLSERSAFVAIALAILAVCPIWMLFSTSYGATLSVVALYLGLIDGVLKLTLDNPATTLGRDVLLYAIVIGAVLRIAITPGSLRFPPLSGFVLAFVLIVAAQVLNPDTAGIARGLGATRPHLEFVPLFFFGFFVMRDAKKLRMYLLLLCVIAAANGVVGFIQFNLSPDQLAAWGPGYAERLGGTGDTSGRTFATVEGEGATKFVRPFGLGPDIGFGGATGVLALPALLALLATARRRWAGRIGAPLGIGIILALATSQARSAVVAAVVAALAYGALSIASQRRASALIGLAALVALAVGGTSLLTARDNSAALTRYSSIAPSKVLSTTFEYRKGTLSLIPKYIVEKPLGQGLGRVGPGASFASARQTGPPVNGESEFNFLLVELGVAGLLIYGALQIKLLALMSRVRKLDDPELRLLLAGCAAPLAGIAASWIAGPTSAGTPYSAFVWFTAGILAYWVLERRPDGDGTAIVPRT